MTVALAALAALVGALVAWVVTVPLYRFKEFRPKTPRDVQNEAGDDIRAEVRHAICPGCHRHCGPADVVPVVSWVKGCPGCGRRVPAVAIALQVGLPLAMAVTASTFTSPWVALPYLWFTVVVAAIAVVDARIWLIPWWMPWVGSAVGLALISVVSVALGEPGAIVNALIGAAGAFGLFFVMWFVAPGKLGFGDVRLAFMIGLFLGWLHPILALYGLLLGSLVGVLLGVVSLAARAGSRFAFGPALAVGALLAVWLHAALVP